MKVFKVERTDNWSYDDYDSFVCCANSADEARRLHPTFNDYYEYQEDGWHYNYREKEKCKYHSWTDDIASLNVTEIIPQTTEVILASFNAG